MFFVFHYTYTNNNSKFYSKLTANLCTEESLTLNKYLPSIQCLYNVGKQRILSSGSNNESYRWVHIENKLYERFSFYLRIYLSVAIRNDKRKRINRKKLPVYYSVYVVLHTIVCVVFLNDLKKLFSLYYHTIPD